MNWPVLNGIGISPTGDGLEAAEAAARAFWQSRATINGIAPPLPDLVDVPALAREVRATWSVA
jgi:hypothetical protein